MLQIQNALTRAEKEETVEKLEKAFQKSAVVYGMKFKNLSVSYLLVTSSGCAAGLHKHVRMRFSAGEANDTLSANFTGWSNKLCMQEHIVESRGRKARLD